MSPSQQSSNNNNTGTMHPAALDLIRELDMAVADMNTQLLQGTKDAESARHNAHMAAELARRFSSNHPESWNPSLSTTADTHSSTTTSTTNNTPLQRPPPPTPHSNGWHVQQQQNTTTTTAPSPPRFTELQNQRLNNTNNTQYLTDELLQANLDLDKVTQQLETEKMQHDETKAQLKIMSKKNAQLQQQLQALTEQLEHTRHQHERELEEKEKECQLLQDDCRLANEDADLALQLTQEKEQERCTWERYVEQLVTRNEELQALLSNTSTAPPALLTHHTHTVNTDDDRSKQKRVYFADETHSRPSRSLVAAGRQLLRRQLAEDDSPLTVNNIQWSERRQQLQKHLQQLSSSHNATEEDEWLGGVRRIIEPTTSGVGDSSNNKNSSRTLQRAVVALDVCRNTATVLKESARRCQLSSSWFHNSDTAATVLDELHLETLAKQYTSLMEVQLSVKHKEIQELESLCKLWEEGIGHDPSHASEV